MLSAEEVRGWEKSKEGEKQGPRKKRRPSDPEEDWLSRALSNPVLTRNKGLLTHFNEKKLVNCTNLFINPPVNIRVFYPRT